VDGTKQKVCYDIDVDVDDTLKAQMNKFLVSTSNQQEIQVIFYHSQYLFNIFFFFSIT